MKQKSLRYLVSSAFITTALSLLIGGYATISVKNSQIDTIDSHLTQIVESVKATFPFYVIRLLGGICYLGGMFLMAYNVYKTVIGKTFVNAPIPQTSATAH